MSIRSISNEHLDNPRSIAESCLDRINAVSMCAADAPQDAGVYDLLKSSDAIADSHVLRLINGLEIEEFIPARVAILLKLSWNDYDVSTSILSNVIAGMRDREKISDAFSETMFSMLQNGQKIHVLHLIYACMRFAEGKDVYRLDDLRNFAPSKLLEYIQSKELVCSKVYLEQKINQLSSQEENEPFRDILFSLKLSMDNDDPFTFKRLYLEYLTLRITSMGDRVEQYILEDLRLTIDSLEPELIFASLYRILKTHDFYGKSLQKVVDLTNSLRDVDSSDRDNLQARCESAFKNTLHLLADYKNMSKGSMTLYSLQHGLMRTEWKKIDALFARTKHKFCDCHAVENRSGFWPMNQPTYVATKPSEHHTGSSETAAVFGCDWGSGHRSATMNVAEILEDRGIHTVNIDIPGDMISSADPAKKKGGGTFSTAKIFNKLLQCKAFALINLLRNVSGLNSVQPPPSRDLIRQTLQRMLLVNPNSAITTVASVSEPIYKAAELMGIPVAHVNTDVDRSILTRAGSLEYRHFKSMIPYPEDVMTPQVSTTEKPEQVVVVGPPTKKVYDIDRSADDIDHLRAELQRDHGIEIPRGKKLVIISSGSNGAFSPYPELLVQKYRGMKKNEIPFVAVVLCGKHNRSYFSHTSNMASRLPGGVIVPKEFVSQEVMEKLYRVASHGGGMIGKAGGLTIFELSKCGTRTLIDNIPAKIGLRRGVLNNLISAINWIVQKIFRFDNFLSWERVNQNFAISQGYATNITSTAQFYDEFEKMLSHTHPVELTTQVHKFSEKLPEVLTAMQAAVEADESMNDRRKYRIDPNLSVNIV